MSDLRSALCTAEQGGSEGTPGSSNDPGQAVRAGLAVAQPSPPASRGLIARRSASPSLAGLRLPEEGSGLGRDGRVQIKPVEGPFTLPCPPRAERPDDAAEEERWATLVQASRQPRALNRNKEAYHPPSSLSVPPRPQQGGSQVAQGKKSRDSRRPGRGWCLFLSSCSR